MLYKIEKKVFESPIHAGIKMNYLVGVPADFKKDEKLPMIVMLHGAGERGDDESLLYIHGVCKYAKRGDLKVRCIVLAPQVPNEKLTWNHLYDEAVMIIKKVAEEYNADEDRISMTGLSMGGYGTWEIGMLYPEMFSALAPICGGGMPWRTDALKNVPVRAFHGDKDDTVPLSESMAMADMMIAFGGNCKLTIFHNVWHDAWSPAYEDTNVIEWLVSQKRKA